MSEGFKTKSAPAKESSRPGRKSTEIASIGTIQQSLVEHFSDIKDPRVERTKKHQLDVSYDKRIEKGHHRREIREVWTVPVAAIGELYQPKLWAGLQTLVMVIRVRHLWNKTTREVQFYLTSLHSNAQIIGRAIRKHWGIENEAHWTLDCTFAEDACRIRSFHGPRNFALLRRFALNALNREQTYKRSLRQKMKRTAMDNNYMVQVLNCFFISNTLDSSDSLCQA
jgi:predicted transposase YbfD/YdcC